MSNAEGEPLHAHELSAADAAVIRMLAGATFGPEAVVTLPSGRRATGVEMARWVKPLPAPAACGDEAFAPTDWQAMISQRERELKAAGTARHSAEAERDRLRRLLEAVGPRVRLVPIRHAPRCIRLSRFRRWKWEVIPDLDPGTGGQGRVSGYSFTRIGAGRALANQIVKGGAL
jgi:hypothetical protein